MKNLIRLFLLAKKRWYLFILGFFFMFGYGIFSVAGIPFVIPLMDYVFNRIPQPDYPVDSVSTFFSTLMEKWNEFTANHPVSVFHISAVIKEFKTSADQIFYQTNPIVLLKIIVFSLILVMLLKNVFFYLNRMVFINLEGKTAKELRDLLFEKYLQLPFSFFEQHKVGDALVRLMNDVAEVNTFLISNGFKIIRDLFTVVLFLAVAISINASLFIKIMIVIPITMGLASFLGKKIKKYTKRLQQQLGLLFSKVEEIFRGLKIVKAYNRESYEKRRFYDLTLKYFKIWRKRIIYDSFNIPLSEMSGTIVVAIVLWFGGLDVLHPEKNFSFGEFSAFLYAIVSIMHPLKMVLTGYTDFKKAMVSLERIYSVFDLEETIKDAPDAVEIADFRDRIEYRDVWFAYKDEQFVLKNISLTIRKGEKVAIVGATGSGKTTLVNLLPRFYDVTKGQILIDGIDIRKISLKSLRSLFGYVTQESFLFSESIFDNISYGSDDKDMEKVVQASDIAYAREFIEKLPDQYQMKISEYGTNLSGGQKQRLNIARAIYHNPPILIFDEATSALDSEAESKVQQAIENVSRNRTMVVIAHRLATVLSSDKIVVLKNGEIVAQGKHEDLLETSPEYKKLYDLQFGGTTG